MIDDGRNSTSVQGRPGRHVCVGAFTGDTGPYPDRSAEIPTLIAIAEGLHFAEDLDGRSTWFAAERVFG